MIITSAPGSTMLLGEHAVLYGHRALVLAVDQRLTVTLVPRADEQIIISSALGRVSGSVRQLPASQALGFVCQAIAHCKPAQGFEIAIDSQISHTVGLSSSAAVTAATLAALYAYQGSQISQAQLLTHTVAVIRAVQGRGSGADAAACVYGGAVAYNAEKIVAEKAEFSAPFALYYLGYKTPTPDVLKRVALWQNSAPTSYQHIYQGMGMLVEEGLAQCAKQDITGLARVMRQYQGYMHALGVTDSETLKLLAELASDERCLAAKISGSGLGDCVLALGDNLPKLTYQHLAVASTDIGVTVEQS
ncbi:mevalonate kinase [Salinibius halmophilus]|uniref:mevalonate kinase n=1 Tax=Salinibius halmophilus TaxID=1853216 RepID=UPI000E662ABC|nr:mevalonate kinase [Salinibius halmophilus]